MGPGVCLHAPSLHVYKYIYIYTCSGYNFTFTERRANLGFCFPSLELCQKKSTEINVGNYLEVLSFFPLESTGLEWTSWLDSSSLLPIFSYPPVSYTVRLCFG